jgi:hypothetical protein
VNPHTDEDIITRARNIKKKNTVSLESEFNVGGREIERLLKTGRNLVMVESNHHEFLYRWLRKGEFKRDPVNFQAACKLADKMVDGSNPLVEGFRLYGQIPDFDNLLATGRIKFLERDEDYKFAGIQLGAHGDIGCNGHRKPSKAGLEKAYGSAVVGHSHTPGILRNIYQVGTSSKLRMDYNKGSSSWVHTSCVVYENSHRQLINCIKGEWCLDEKAKKVAKGRPRQ